MATFSSFPGAAAGFAALLLLAVSAQVQVHAETTTPPGIAVLASSDQFIFTDDACTQGREPWGRVSLLAKEEGCAQYWQGAVGKAPVTWNTVYQQTSPLAGGTAVDFLIYRDQSGNCSGTGESSTGGVGYGAAQICAGYLQGVCTKVPSPLGDWKNGAGVRVGSFLMTTPFPKEQVAKSHFAEVCASTQAVVTTNATTNATTTTQTPPAGPVPGILGEMTCRGDSLIMGGTVTFAGQDSIRDRLNQALNTKVLFLDDGRTDDPLYSENCPRDAKLLKAALGNVDIYCSGLQPFTCPVFPRPGEPRRECTCAKDASFCSRPSTTGCGATATDPMTCRSLGASINLRDCANSIAAFSATNATTNTTAVGSPGVGEEEWSLVGDGLCRADDGEYAKRNGVSPYLAALHGVVENTGQDGLAECKAACRKRVPQCVAINYDEKIGDCDLVGNKLGTTQFGGSFGAFVGGSPASEFGSVDRDIVTYSSAHDKREGGHVCLVYRPACASTCPAVCDCTVRVVPQWQDFATGCACAPTATGTAVTAMGTDATTATTAPAPSESGTTSIAAGAAAVVAVLATQFF